MSHRYSLKLCGEGRSGAGEGDGEKPGMRGEGSRKENKGEEEKGKMDTVRDTTRGQTKKRREGD